LKFKWVNDVALTGFRLDAFPKSTTEFTNMATQNLLTSEQLNQLAELVFELLDNQPLNREQVDEFTCMLLDDIAGFECATETEIQEITDEIWNSINQTRG
jgi:hypothetical protein